MQEGATYFPPYWSKYFVFKKGGIVPILKSLPFWLILGVSLETANSELKIYQNLLGIEKVG